LLESNHQPQKVNHHQPSSYQISSDNFSVLSKILNNNKIFVG
jgi:hypothetical protein